MKKKILVIGASTNPERYAYKATHLLYKLEHPTVLFGQKTE
jgi:predicted CoA-binding protein